MGLISGVLTAAISLGGYSYMVQASDGLGGVWEMIMGQALVPVSAVWSTIIVQPHRRCCCGWSGQYVLHPQAPERVIERSRT